MTNAQPPLVRPLAGRWIAGVCQAVANRLGVSVALVRILTVLLGVPLVAYVVAWVLIPSE
ncbi:PspC domain-containing protein [Microbacterium gorillae]|uniref:PspC domain-containing protein n=1 Tax=Microbacterium gorillae TaxID=1231063 RepID=UPI00058ECB41|nr:PspC domain-containing protein [Microbacterium gorillae]